jgi:hypothetical protein
VKPSNVLTARAAADIQDHLAGARRQALHELAGGHDVAGGVVGSHGLRGGFAPAGRARSQRGGLGVRAAARQADRLGGGERWRQLHVGLEQVGVKHR